MNIFVIYRSRNEVHGERCLSPHPKEKMKVNNKKERKNSKEEKERGKIEQKGERK